ncbi:hypothetical protein P9112_010856 [Eukaryota sp. TZLM1-RC]
MPLRHILSASDFTREEFLQVLDLAKEMKTNPKKFTSTLEGKTLLMLFEKPSLRTRVSFETGMTRLGGHAIYYDIKGSPLGVKETYADTANVLSRMVEYVMARVNRKEDLRELAKYSTIPVINALDDYAHPMQMLADFLTVREHKGQLEGLKFSYVGDIANNVTYDILRASIILGVECSVAGPTGEKFEVEESVIQELDALVRKYGGKYTITHDPKEAVKGADVVYTDSWMSYHISKEEEQERLEHFKSYRVTQELMSHAKSDALFLHCLPASRGVEVDAEVIDGPQSVIFDEAENRMWTEMACVAWLQQQLEQ